MLKFNLITLVLFVLILVPAFAGDNATETPLVSGIASIKLVGNYDVDAGQRFSDQTGAQGFLGITLNPSRRSDGLQLYVEYWGSAGKDNGYGQFIREDDLTFQASKSFGRTTLSGGVLAIKTNKNDLDLSWILQPRVLFSYQAGAWNLKCNVKYAFTNPDYMFDGGWFLETGVSRSVPLWKHMSFTTDTLVTRDVNGAFGFTPTTTIRTTNGLALGISESITVWANYKYAYNLGQRAPDDFREQSYGTYQVGIDITF